MPQLEIRKPEERRKQEKRVNGVFWIILLNLGLYVADHIFQVLDLLRPSNALFNFSRLLHTHFLTLYLVAPRVIPFGDNYVC